MHPLDNAKYGVERSVATSLRCGRKSKQRRKGHAPAYRHGTCPVAHRTPEAAAKCRNR
jgi:hypothetical protein